MTSPTLPTKRQSQLLQLVISSLETKGYVPPYRELMKLMGLSSPASIHKLMQQLEAKGLLLDAKQHVHTASSKIPIIGTIAKGKSLELFATATYYDLPTSMADHSCYGFTIRDDSFYDDCFLKDDLLIIEASKLPLAGELVLATSREMGCTIFKYDESVEESFEIQGCILHAIRTFFKHI
jgi:SOS-response transcriptional repressor LexA